MKRSYFLKSCLLYITAFFAFGLANAADKIRVACVGDSITAGSGIVDPAKNSYPVQLQNILGAGYEVKNFGVSGRTLLRNGDNPYWNEKAFENAKNFRPNIVVIKLGTNDSKPQNMKFKEDFVKDYTDLVNEFKKLPSKPKVFLALPVYAAREAWGINESDITETVIPALKKAAAATKTPVIDLHSITHSKPEFFVDGIHPNNYGAGIIAQAVASAIKGDKTAPQATRRTWPSPAEEWHGFNTYKWQYANSFMKREAIVVEPKIAADDKPWIWRPAFFGHEPQVDVALLKLGFHVVYLDVTNDYGSPKSIAFGAAFHDFLVREYGFAPKADMEGMSRGGYYSLRFATEHPDKVATLYIDAPVCDIKVWNTPALNSWKDVLSKWEDKTLTPENFPANPMNHLKNIAKKVAIISVCGDSDKIVDINEHTRVLKKKYEALGGKIKVIEKPGVDHHPHSLQNPAPIVDFIIENQPNYKKEKYLEKVKNAKAENPDALFTDVKHKINIRGSLKNSQAKFESGAGVVAFVGGSITEMDGWRNLVKDSLKRRFPNTKFTFIDAGISSTGSTPHAFRFENDVLKTATPDLLFFEAAANDMVNAFSAADQVKGVEGIIRQARAANPKMDIIMLQMAYEDFNTLIFNGTAPEAIATHEKVANHYAIPSIDLANEIVDIMKADKLNWFEFGGGHPSWYGHKAYMRSIDALLDQMWSPKNNVRPAPHKMPQTPLDKFSYAKGKFIDIKEAKFKSGWSIEDKWQPKVKSGTRKSFVDVPMLSSDETNAELKLTFTGSAVGIFCATGPDAGIIEYSVDGGAFKKLDTYTGWSGGLYIPWVFMFEKELSKGRHTLTLKMSDEKNPKSKGYSLHIRNFVVNQ